MESRIGIYYVDEKRFEWLKEGEWKIEQGYLGNSNTSMTEYINTKIKIAIIDRVHPNHDLIIRKFVIENLTDRAIKLRLYHCQAFNIKQSLFQETCYFNPDNNSIIHYKEGTYLSISGVPSFSNYACGERVLKGLKGTYIDAEDGKLEGGKITHGSVDSAVEWTIDVEPKKAKPTYMLILCGENIEHINKEYNYVMARRIENLEMESDRFWSSWISSIDIKFPKEMGEKIKEIYRTSFFTLANCTDGNGAIIASPDIRSLNVAGDTYVYCWWRDGGYVSMAMCETGMQETARRFLEFAARCQSKEGYFVHRHLPDGSIGSTWHPPPFIQIDQTATVISALWRYYLNTKDIVFLLDHWPMVKSAATFLQNFIDTETGLPKPSFDLWEEKIAINIYSVASVIRALMDAERIAKVLGKHRAEFGILAENMKANMLEKMYENGLLKSIKPVDRTTDASMLMLINLGIIEPQDKKAIELVKRIDERLWSKKVGGVARYEGDIYWGNENPWIICTLWLAEAHIHLGNREKALALIEWVANKATKTNLLPEQIHSQTGEVVSAFPLTWSHATFISTVNRYMERFGNA